MIYVQKSVQVINVHLHEFPQNEYTRVTIHIEKWRPPLEPPPQMEGIYYSAQVLVAYSE